MEAVYHQVNSRIFHDWNYPTSSSKVAEGLRHQPCASIMSCKAVVAVEAIRHMAITLGANMLAAVHE